MRLRFWAALLQVDLHRSPQTSAVTKAARGLSQHSHHMPKDASTADLRGTVKSKNGTRRKGTITHKRKKSQIVPGI